VCTLNTSALCGGIAMLFIKLAVVCFFLSLVCALIVFAAVVAAGSGRDEDSD
jgi:hypothetical protein